MPISVHIDEGRRRLWTRAVGIVTFADIRDHIRMELTFEQATYVELVDFSAATTNVTSEQIRLLAIERERIEARQRRSGAVAFVATSDIFFGMLRMFDSLTEDIRPIRVFRALPEAEAWLKQIESMPASAPPADGR